uniref:DUF19 domain-containing protein n=1 Tax=Trichobilharzia regenti TaxID=157069 RepID=A0AA85JTE0_TRIRE|nr:unnamed protein product [Trichobilharzia regenti]
MDTVVKMKFIIMYIISLLIVCQCVMITDPLALCNQNLQLVTEMCFSTSLSNIGQQYAGENLKDLRELCKQYKSCVAEAKNCLLTEFDGIQFANCPTVKALRKSMNRIFV